MGSWAHTWTPYAQAFVQFRADQARSCAYKLRNSGVPLGLAERVEPLRLKGDWGMLRAGHS
jgi:hypothetical protein